MQTFCGWLLKLCGWRIHGTAPEERRYVLIAAPHTSNWDLLWLLLMTRATGVPVSWLGKHTLFRGPLGWCLRALGGVPVVRHEREDRVAATARAFANHETLVLAIPPEGTRSRTPHWRSGFLHIARTAGVPLVPTALDYRRRVGEIGPALHVRDDPRAVMDALRAFYADRHGRHADRFGPVRLLDEDASLGDPAAESR